MLNRVIIIVLLAAFLTATGIAWTAHKRAVQVEERLAVCQHHEEYWPGE